MSTDLRQLLSAEKYLLFYAGRKKLTSRELPPIAVELHWTSDCNYDCTHCSYGSRRQAKGKLSADQIQSVVNDLIAMKTLAVYLSGGGEPTLIKGWDGYARQLMDGGVEVALITNGVALSDAHAEILRRMNYIAVSVYSTDEGEYRKITGSRFFDRQWFLPEMVKGNGGTGTVVGARCVLNKINYKNVAAIYLRAREAGYDYIIFIPAVDYEERGVGLGTGEQEEMLRIISQSSILFDPAFTNVGNLLARGASHYVQMDCRAGMVNAGAGCTAVQIRANAFVNYCGGVWLCQPHIGNPAFRIGELNDAGFSKIWNSPRHQEVIASLNSEFAAGRCRNCRSISLNRIADQFDQGAAALVERPLDPFI